MYRPSCSLWWLDMVVLLATVGLPAPAGVAAAQERPRIEERFDGGTFNRQRWSIDPRNPPGVRFDLGQDNLRILIPPGPAGRNAASMQTRQLRIEGDFDLRMDYRLLTFPQPKKEWTNVEIFIEGPDGKAAVIRANHSQRGSGTSGWFQPAAGRKEPGYWRQIATSDTRGTLRLERAGKTLRYQRCVNESGVFEELGTIEFGSAELFNVEFRVTAPATNALVEVELDNIVLEADRLIGPPTPARLLFGPASLVSVIVVLLASGGLCLYYWRVRRAETPIAAK